MLIPITAIIASALAFFYMRLAFAVIKQRRTNKVALGSGDVPDLERAIRAHGNFAEYAPLALILLGCLELNGAPWWIVASLGAVFTAGRIIHAKAMHDLPPKFDRRVLGMALTFNTIGLAAAANLILVGLKFFHIL